MEWPFDARLSMLWWKDVKQLSFPRQYASRLAALEARASDLGNASEETIRVCLLKANGHVGDAAGLLLALKSNSLSTKEVCADFLGSLPHLGSVGSEEAWKALEDANWNPLKTAKRLQRKTRSPSFSSSGSVTTRDPRKTSGSTSESSVKEECVNPAKLATSMGVLEKDASLTARTMDSTRASPVDRSDHNQPPGETFRMSAPYNSAQPYERIAYLEGENARLASDANVAGEIRQLMRVNQLLVERVQKLEEENAKLREHAKSVHAPKSDSGSAPSRVNPSCAPESPRQVQARLEGLTRRWQVFRNQLCAPQSPFIPRLGRSNSVVSLRDRSMSPSTARTSYPRLNRSASMSLSSKFSSATPHVTPSPRLSSLSLDHTRLRQCTLTPKQQTRPLLKNPPPLLAPS